MMEDSTGVVPVPLIRGQSEKSKKKKSNKLARSGSSKKLKKGKSRKKAQLARGVSVPNLDQFDTHNEDEEFEFQKVLGAQTEDKKVHELEVFFKHSESSKGLNWFRSNAKNRRTTITDKQPFNGSPPPPVPSRERKPPAVPSRENKPKASSPPPVPPQSAKPKLKAASDSAISSGTFSREEEESKLSGGVNKLTIGDEDSSRLEMEKEISEKEIKRALREYQKRVDELVKFYKKVDPARPEKEKHCQKLLKKYPPGNVAISLKKKYGEIPSGWEDFYEEAQGAILFSSSSNLMAK